MLEVTIRVDTWDASNRIRKQNSKGSTKVSGVNGSSRMAHREMELDTHDLSKCTYLSWKPSNSSCCSLMEASRSR
jgi:hypothetical protein